MKANIQMVVLSLVLGLGSVAANAELISVSFTGTGSYYDYIANGNLIDTDLTITYTFDTDDLPADINPSVDSAYYIDFSSNWLTASLLIDNTLFAAQSSWHQDNILRNVDELIVTNLDEFGYEHFLIQSQADLLTGGWFNAGAYWRFLGESHCITGQTIYEVAPTCDLTPVAQSGVGPSMFFEIYDLANGVNIYASGRATSASVRRFGVLDPPLTVPEPSTLALFGLGLLGLGFARGRA